MICFRMWPDRDRFDVDSDGDDGDTSDTQRRKRRTGERSVFDRLIGKLIHCSGDTDVNNDSC